MERPGVRSEKIHTGLRYAEHAPDVWATLGKLQRTGWVVRGIENPETVQEHIVALRELVIGIANELTEFSDKDKQDILDMLEVHDWPEAVIGDLVNIHPDEAERKRIAEQKFKMEKEAMTQICRDLGDTGIEIFNAWLRFEESSDPVAAFARQVDKFQPIEKALEYNRAGENGLPEEFITFSGKGITHPLLLRRLAVVEAALKNPTMP